ncbi:MAG: hypothetical protein ACKVOM_02435 [Ferruginibacter sp.]
MLQQQLFNKIFYAAQSTGNVLSALKNVTADHPYFGMAHFFSLKNANQSVANFADKAAQTALFFNSPFYLQSLLSEENAEVKMENQFIETKSVEEVLIPQSLDPEIVAIITKENLTETATKEAVTQKNEDQLLYEPLHASDYFASLGIKLSEDAFASDKLGKQLKSFTAWLKTMKKVNADKLPVVSASTETAVKTQAEKSNMEEDIVTEPMAEAYILQNKREKAMDIYNKLSLLNPAKSAYFAAKIDSLK